MYKIITILLFFFTLTQNIQANYFIAVDIPKEVEHKLDQVKKKLAQQLYGKFEEKEKFHITLKFLGKLSKNEALLAQNQLKNILKKRCQFKIFVKNLGFFPNIKRARVVWLGIQSKELNELGKLINHNIKEFKEDAYKFNPHITLARLSCTHPSWLLKKFQTEINSKKILTKFIVTKIFLLKSNQGKYFKITSFPLKNKNSW